MSRCRLYHGGMDAIYKHHIGFHRPIGVLSSFATVRKIHQPEWADQFFLDSGAFSAWKSGTVIDFEEYCRFLQTHAEKVTTYAALDVIGDPEASMDTYLRMKGRGLNPLPAYHEGEDISYLHEYAKMTDYIGLGGIALADKKQRHKFLDKVFTLYPDPSVVGFHGYGVTDPDLLRTYPWRTADSTGAYFCAFSGRLQTPWGTYCVGEKVAAPAKAWQDSEMGLAKVRDWVESLGYSWEVINKNDREGRIERMKVNAYRLECIADEAPIRYNPTSQFFL